MYLFYGRIITLRITFKYNVQFQIRIKKILIDIINTYKYNEGIKYNTEYYRINHKENKINTKVSFGYVSFGYVKI